MSLNQIRIKIKNNIMLKNPLHHMLKPQNHLVRLFFSVLLLGIFLLEVWVNYFHIYNMGMTF